MQNGGNSEKSNHMPNAMSHAGLEFFTIFLQFVPIASLTEYQRVTLQYTQHLIDNAGTVHF